MQKRLLVIVILLPLFIASYGRPKTKQIADLSLNAVTFVTADTTSINILLESAYNQLDKSGKSNIDIDSAAIFLERANRLNNRSELKKFTGEILFLESRIERERGHRSRAIALAGKAIEVLKKENNSLLLAQVYIEIAQNYNQFDPQQLLERINLIRQGIQYFRQNAKTNKHTLLKANALNQLSQLYVQVPDYTRALTIAQEALESYRSVNYSQIHSIYDLIALIHYLRNDLEKAIKYELIALRTVELLKDSTMKRCEIENFTGMIYYTLGQKEKAMPFFIRALKFAEINNDENYIKTLFGNIVSNYIELNKPKEALRFAKSVPRKYLAQSGKESDSFVPLAYMQIYIALNHLKEAGTYRDRLIEFLNRKAFQPGLKSNLNTELAKFYLASKNYFEALRYLKLNEKITTKSPHQTLANYRLWHAVDTAMHNYKDANEHFLKFFAIHDSLFNEKKNRQIQQLQVQYESEKKESEIKIKNQRILFLTASDRLQKAELTKTRLIKDVTIAVISFLLVITALIYKQYLSNQVINKIMLQTQETTLSQNRLINQKNLELQFLVEEKEWLLKEVHHRVKNNLQTIICLLESQAAYLENDALKAIETSQNRIYTMSLIHQKLYQSEDIQTIDMALYISELIHYLKDSFNIASYKVSFRVRIDPIGLDAVIAIPLALIINEAITNSIKYAFPGDVRGEISILLEDLGEIVKLEISDNGIGMTKDDKDFSPNSLGFQLIRGLTKEINGTVNIDSNIRKGVKISLLFRKDVSGNRDLTSPDGMTA
jgi:two-component sensor histidine kinase